jgi:hypothetical protein
MVLLTKGDGGVCGGERSDGGLSMVVRRSGLRAEAKVAGGRRCSEGTTSMATMEAITTATTSVETPSIPSPAVDRKNKESSLCCKETEMAWIHAYLLKFRSRGLVSLARSQ